MEEPDSKVMLACRRGSIIIIEAWRVESANHCTQWIEEGEAHECWKTTEAALTQDLSQDLQDDWERLRETAVSFADERIYASHKSIMLSRRPCYFFVRPKSNVLELC